MAATNSVGGEMKAADEKNTLQQYYFHSDTDLKMNAELVVTFILFLFVVGLWLFRKIFRKQNSELPAKALETVDRVFTASRVLIRVIALLLGCALWWLPLTFMPKDLEGIICMGSFGTLLIIYGLVGPDVITRFIEKMDGVHDDNDEH